MEQDRCSQEVGDQFSGAEVSVEEVGDGVTLIKLLDPLLTRI